MSMIKPYFTLLTPSSAFAPLSFTLAGLYRDGNTIEVGVNGRYAVATSYSAVSTRGLIFDTTYVQPQGAGYKLYGRSLRCVGP